MDEVTGFASKELEDNLRESYTKEDYGSPLLALLATQWMIDIEKSTRLFQKRLEGLEEEISEILHNRVKDQVDPLSKSIVMKYAKSTLDDFVEEVVEHIRVNSKTRIADAIANMNKELVSKGAQPISDLDIDKITIKLTDSINTSNSLGSGLPYATRLQVWIQTYMYRLYRILSDRYKKGELIQTLTDLLHRSLSMRGRTGIPGGSLIYKVQAIISAEETRIGREAMLEVIRQSSVEYAYWRLNPNHPWYPGGEICEWLASLPFAGSYEKLKYSGLEGVDTVGLYEVSDYPDYPHPFCGCYPEPLVPGFI